MTHKAELEYLQFKARANGRVCNFSFDEEGRMDGVFYISKWINPLEFAERERPRAWKWTGNN